MRKTELDKIEKPPEKPFKPEHTHETEKIKIKEAEIDKGIIPVIKWLNSFSDVYTFFSCEDDPYVVFSTTCPSTLAIIVREVKQHRHAHVTVDVYQGILRYNIRFHSREFLDSFIDKIEKRYRF